MRTLCFVALFALLYVVNCATTSDRKVMVVTFNVAHLPPKEDLADLLSVKSKPADGYPDFYAIGLEEVAASVSSMAIPGFTEPWVKALKATLVPLGYKRVETINILNIYMVVFAKLELVSELKEVQTGYTKTGILDVIGNKGGVAVRMVLGKTSICFVAAHLAAHDEKNDQRIKDFHAIVRGTRFKKTTMLILEHDYVIWTGDLNFRINTFTTDQVHKAITSPNPSPALIQDIMSMDQLTVARQKGEAFAGFEELQPTFMPTFKFHIGTNDYNLKRTPAWTDRVLFKVAKKPGLAVQQVTYTAHTTYTQSDHKPVSSLLLLKVV